MSVCEVLKEMEEKYGEWLEEAGREAPLMMNCILANKLLQERNMTSYLSKLLQKQERKR